MESRIERDPSADPCLHRPDIGGPVVRVVVVGRKRPLWQIVLLYIVTFGIFRRIWLYRVNKEVDGHAGLGFNHRQTLWLLILPIIGPSIVTWQTAYRMNNYLYTEEPLPYGPTWGLWAGTLLPILGNAAFMAWTQDRLNIFWELEKENKWLAMDIDQGLSKDAKFQARVKKAQTRSEQAGSRADDKPTLRDIKREREDVRALGGSTPVLPWKRPEPEPPRILHVECSKCATRFDAERNLYESTPIVCPKCGKSDVLPSLRSDELAQPEGALVTILKVDCPKCKTTFHAARDLDGPTDIVCPECGHKGSVPGPKTANLKTKTS